MPYVLKNEAGDIVGEFASPQPGITTTWLADDHADMTAKALLEAKGALKVKVDEYLAAKLAQGFEYPAASGRYLQIRDADRNNLTAMALQATLCKIGALTWDDEFSWTMLDNDPLALPTEDDMIEMAAQGSEMFRQWRKAAKSHKEAIDELTTLAAVNAYNITAGW